MADESVFEAYFVHRCDLANAVTPGQQLQVLQTLRREAEEEGRVPLSSTSVAQVDLHNPTVQAILRGEDVTVGAETLRSGGSSGRLPQAKNLTNTTKILIMAGIVLIPTLAALLFAATSKKRHRETLPTATPTVTIAPTLVEATPTPTLSTTATPEESTYMFSGGEGENIVYLPMDNPAAPDAVSPASVEIADKHFVVQAGTVDEESGVWSPQGGVEWLPTTHVRKVIAIPETLLEGIDIHPGMVIRLRYRDGYVVNYSLTRVIPDLLTDQIEILNGNTPSLVVIAYTNNLREPRRMVLLAEMALPLSYQPQQYIQPTPTPQPTEKPPADLSTSGVIAVDNVNLRSGPSVYAPVLALLSRMTEVVIHTDVPRTEADGYTWIYVSVADQEGWVADYLVIPQN